MSIGYTRRRTTLGGAVEGHLTTAILLLAGVAVVGVFLAFLGHLLALF